MPHTTSRRNWRRKRKEKRRAEAQRRSLAAELARDGIPWRNSYGFADRTPAEAMIRLARGGDTVTKAKARRLELGLSQQDLANRTGLWTSDISRIETRRLVPYVGQAQRIADVLGLDPSELQDEVEDVAR